MSERAEPDVKIVRGAPDGTELAAVLLALRAAPAGPGRLGSRPRLASAGRLDRACAGPRRAPDRP
ncbi:acyl-CoA carboxylase epsilon subunit [Streptomyces sp. NPDC058412]|uniref:acyl-CoA carboxylase epsilon subunit n=1 Tax=Streptomyces sp. NPDC058412 TaxID=3346486 RepID=UPI0036600AC6